MIDIHSHILPGVDDGSPDMEKSLEMLRMAADDGTTDIVATPHSNLQYRYDEHRIRAVFEELSDKARGLIQLHLGCDFHLSVDNVQDALAHPAKYTINGQGYLMVELPELASLPALRAVFNRLLETRIIPIITHPERNPSVQTNLKDLHGWVRDGCLLQVTAQSLTGRFGARSKKAADSLLNSDLVHFIASDAHDTQDRVPVLSPAYKLITHQFGAAKADRLFIHHPAAALVGQAIYAIPEAVKSPFFSFLGRSGKKGW